MNQKGSLRDRYQKLLKERCRVRDLGLHMGEFPTGPLNCITDVKGVLVGHTTLVEGSGRRKPGNGPVRTGVTVVLPNDDVYNHRVETGGFVLSGAGEIAGLTQAMEWGIIETPILLTNTMSVGRVSDGVVKWMGKKYPALREQEVVIPVVGECDDSFLNDSAGQHIRPEHVFQALENADTGPVAEGAVGAGTGMVCCDFKAGIGTASRVVTVGDKKYRMGVLVNSNFGHMEHLRMDGYPVGRILSQNQGNYRRRTENYGSIIVVLATDLPLVNRQLNRICRRAALGVGRVGSYGAHGSGEIIIGFSTTNTVKRSEEEARRTLTVMADEKLDPAYRAVIEMTEEAILNSITMGVDMEGAGGNRVPAINLKLLRGLLEHYNSVQALVSSKE
jgi:D-aminopeptidase